MQMPKKYLPLVVAGVLGLAATFLVNMYIRQREKEAVEGVKQRQKDLTLVVVAKQDIPTGTAIEGKMLKEETVHKDMLQPRAATAMDRVVGRIALVPFSKGEQILLNKVTLSGLETSLSSKVPAGKRGITVPVDNISSVGGMVRPGDHVDVVGMVPMPAIGPDGKPAAQMNTVPLFQNVLVLAVGQDFTNTPGSSEQKEKTMSPIITLALSPQEANLIAFIQEQGKIRLILRSPGDTQTQPASATRAGWDTVLRTVMPEAFQEQPGMPKELPKPKKQVEIYRGLQKEVKSLE